MEFGNTWKQIRSTLIAGLIIGAAAAGFNEVLQYRLQPVLGNAMVK